MNKLILFAPVALAACQTGDMSMTLATICPTVDKLHASFITVATVNEKVAARADEEMAAYSIIKAACDNPQAATPGDIAIAIATAYATWKLARVE